MGLSDKRVLITGADRGIGKGIALAFAKTGARIAAHGLIDEKQGAVLVEELLRAGSPEARCFNGDLREASMSGTTFSP
jgi:NAD(P)-dependent dehydrogenase (short-subunit alcohol dehydrogenase family)